MNDYVPNEFVAFYFRDPQHSEHLMERAVEQIEERSPYCVCDLWLSPKRQIGIVNLSARPVDTRPPLLSRLKSSWWTAQPHTNRLKLNERMALLQAGYITTAERAFERSIREVGDHLQCGDAGGIAAFCAACFDGEGDERLFAWSTRPSVRVVGSAEGREAVVIGSRPRLVHALTRDFSRPSLDLRYVHASLNGWSLDDLTPYEGTTLLSVDTLLRVCGATRSRHPHPTAGFRREERIFRKLCPQYRDALHDAVEPLRALRGFELRLSGGKDSRLLAAALWSAGITPTTVICHGPEDSPDVQVARRVAETLGWELRRAQPNFAYLGSLVETVRHNLVLSDGFLATEPRHLAFEIHSLAGDVGPGLVLGHMELQKGGWSTTADASRDRLAALGRQKVTRWRDCVVPDLAHAARNRIDEYVAGLSFEDEAEYGYWINYQFRVGRWLTSHYLSHSKEHLPVYPLIDEKVTRVVSCAPLKHLVNERLLAETTWSFGPALRELPTLEPYRFIVEKEKRRRARARRKLPSPRESHSSGAPSIAAPSHAAGTMVVPSNPLEAIAQYIAIDRAHELAEHVRGGKLRDELRNVLLPHVWAVIEEPSYAKMAATQVDPIRLVGFLWTCYQASVLYTDGLGTW